MPWASRIFSCRHQPRTQPALEKQHMHSGHYLETLDLNREVLAAIDRHFVNPFSAVRRSPNVLLRKVDSCKGISGW